MYCILSFYIKDRKASVEISDYNALVVIICNNEKFSFQSYDVIYIPSDKVLQYNFCNFIFVWFFRSVELVF